MKKIFVLGFAAVMSALSMMAEESFMIEGSIPGLRDGALVKLSGVKGGRSTTIAETSAENGRFVLNGSVDCPTVCRLSIVKAEGRKGDAAVDILVDNSSIKVSASHIDSVPPSNYVGTRGRLRQENVTISGGKLQDEYNVYNKYMLPYDLDQLRTNYNANWSSDLRTLSAEDKSKREKEFYSAVAARDNARRKFITEHPNYVISVIIMADELKSPFVFTDKELDMMHQIAVSCSDKVCSERAVKAVADSRKFARGADYTDFEMLDRNGEKHRFSKEINDGKYVFIDFWASWCGPCRQAIPHVRGLHENHKDKVDVVSVSVDDENADWIKALDEEKMNWKQFRLPIELRDRVTEGYRCKSLPYMVVISPDRKVVYAGHNSAEAEAAFGSK